MPNFSRLLMVVGLLLFVSGLLLYILSRSGWFVHLPLGRLPGDIRIQTGNVTCFFPLATMLLLSVLLTILLNVIARLLNR